MKRALIVGINKYPYMPGSDLRGCLNDAAQLRETLLARGFEPDNIRVLTDERATKSAILDRLLWLVRESQDGDIAFFSFSGHGSQSRDRNGDELSDHLDEIIIPSDFTWLKENWISDDDLVAIFKQLRPGVRVEAVIDSCHSGDITRSVRPFVGPEICRAVPGSIIKGDFSQDRIARFLPPPLDLACRIRPYMVKNRILGFLATKTTQIIMEVAHDLTESIATTATEKPTAYSVITGCADNETSADAYIEGDYHGAMTWNLCKNIALAQTTDFIGIENGQAVSVPATRANLLNWTRTKLQENGFTQTPQLECSEGLETKCWMEF